MVYHEGNIEDVLIKSDNELTYELEKNIEVEDMSKEMYKKLSETISNSPLLQELLGFNAESIAG